MEAISGFFPTLAGRSLSGEVMTDYYDAAWQLRRQVFEKWIAAGETSLPRLLARFESLERDHGIVAVGDGQTMSGTLVYKSMVGAKTEMACDRLEAWRPGIIQGRDVSLLPFMKFDLAAMLAGFAQDVDTIVELGAGFGPKLFQLFLAGGPVNARYVAGEISPAGRDLARMLAALEPRLRFDARPFDLSRPDWSLLEGAGKALIFTSWALMYVNAVPDDFFQTLAAWPGEAILVFCEPLGFQWGGNAAPSHQQILACAQGRLNGNLAKALTEATGRGLIEPMVVAADVFSPSHDPFDLMSVAVYAKAARA